MKNEKQALMPRLRFPEFREAGDWKEKPLGDCLDYIQPTKYLVSSTDYDDKYPTPVLTAGKTFVLGYTNETKGIFNNNLPVIIFDDFTTASKFVDFPFKGKSSAMKILLAKKGVDIKFIYEAMQLIRYEVGVHERHWISIFSKLSVSVPTHFEEQQKIADCLSSLDALIAAQADKIDALKTHKKGLMQKLFPREGETVPRLRFPEFRDAGEWGRTQLSTQVELISGLHLSPTEYSDSGEIPYFTGPSDYSNELSTVRKWTARSENVGRSDDTLITVKGNGVGELLRLKLDEVAMGRQLMAVRPSIAHGGFIFYFLETQRQRLIALASGNLIPGLSRGDILSLEILVPEKQEQMKVANCLSALDALITASTENLDALKTHKKGLMRQLFPSPEAIGV